MIHEIECNWWIHNVIHYAKYEELFSIDKKCPAFQTIVILSKINNKLFSNTEQSLYLQTSHPR